MTMLSKKTKTSSGQLQTQDLPPLGEVRRHQETKPMSFDRETLDLWVSPQVLRPETLPEKPTNDQ